MNIYIICAVRNANESATQAVRAYAKFMRENGHQVHFPPDDVDQNDPTGLRICEAHRTAMEAADEVHIFWDAESKGSHFDLGMAFALRKKLVPVSDFEDTVGKSYWKVINELTATQG